jgi:hypothetical protein
LRSDDFRSDVQHGFVEAVKGGSHIAEHDQAIA